MNAATVINAVAVEGAVMPEPPFTDAEKKRLRALLGQDDKVTWLWSSLGVWIKWGGGIGVSVALLWDHLKSFGRGLKALWNML